MKKIEKILNSTLEFTNIEDLTTVSRDSIVDSLKEFGKLCFEAGRDQYWDDGGSGCLEFKYYEYEDFLKEIEDETGN